MDAIIQRCCGLDIHKKVVVACLITPGWMGGGPRENCALRKGLRGPPWLWLTMDDAGISLGKTKPHLKTREVMVDRLPEAGVFSFHPIGLGQDRLKWGIPDYESAVLRSDPCLDRGRPISPSESMAC